MIFPPFYAFTTVGNALVDYLTRKAYKTVSNITNTGVIIGLHSTDRGGRLCLPANKEKKEKIIIKKL